MEENKHEQDTSSQDFAPAHRKQEGDQSPPLTQETTNGSHLELGTRATYITNGAAAGISQEHRDYLLQRHGTLDLDRVPTMDPADPYNWKRWKKLANLVCVALHAMTTTFIAASIIPAYENISMDLGCTLQAASYLTSLQIATLGFALLFWKPLSNRYGHRPGWLISTIGALLFNIRCALSHSYDGGVSGLSCFLYQSGHHDRQWCRYGDLEEGARQVYGHLDAHAALWTVHNGIRCVPDGQLPMDLLGAGNGISNIRSLLNSKSANTTQTNGAQFVAYLFFGPETRYIRQGVRHEGSAFKQEYLNFKRVGPNPLNPLELVQPFALFKYGSILIPTIAYSIVFGFASVLINVEIPQLFVPKFGFNAQEIGLQFLGIIIGSIIGEQLGGRLSDGWMNRRAKKLGDGPQPEYRLWLSYGCFLLAMVGLLVFGIRTEQAPKGHWNVTPIVGIAIAACGNQIVTTVLATYAVDCHTEYSASIGVFVNAIRSTWGFIGPFWFPDMLASVGGSGSGGIMAGLIFVFRWVLIMFVQWKAHSWRRQSE